MFFVFNKDKIISVMITLGIVIVLFCTVSLNPKISEETVLTSTTSKNIVIMDNEDTDNTIENKNNS